MLYYGTLKIGEKTSGLKVGADPSGLKVPALSPEVTLSVIVKRLVRIALSVADPILSDLGAEY